MCDLTVEQMNKKQNLFWELLLYKFKLSHKIMEVIKKHLYDVLYSGSYLMTSDITEV